MLSRRNGHANGDIGPFAMMDILSRDMDGLFAGLDRSLAFPSTALRRLAPTSGGPGAIDLEDAGDRFVVRADVPGVREEDLEVTFERGSITIRARRDAAPPEGHAVHQKQRTSFEMTRTVELPAPVDVDRAEASLRDGVLEIALPKSPEAAPRRLSIKTT
jgi:HSP20 family protein